jgi:hypothetical protein
MLLIVMGLLLVYLTYTKTTGQFIGAIVNAQPG